MTMGLFREWDSILPEQTAPTRKMFLIAWLAVFVVLILAIPRVPMVTAGAPDTRAPDSTAGGR